VPLTAANKRKINKIKALSELAGRERWGRPPTQGLGILVPANGFRRLTEKIVRGIYFLEDKKFIEPPYFIEFYALTDDGALPIREQLDPYARARHSYTTSRSVR
jgi:hypothetical protein